MFSRKEEIQRSHAESEQLAVPELVLSMIKIPDEPDQAVSNLSLPWAALVLLPHLR